MDDISRSLEKEYCPPLDSSLFYSFFSEYLDQQLSLDKLRSQLDILKEITLSTDDAVFDPSGTSRLHDDTESHESSERALSWQGDLLSDSTGDTDLTNISQAFESVNLGDSPADGLDLNKGQYDDWLESLSPEDKKKKLKEIFCDAKDFDIGYILRKNGGNYHKSLDELLTQARLEEEGLKGKGIDAFAGSAMSGRERKAVKERDKRQRKGKRQPIRRTSSTPAFESIHDNTSSSNEWLRVDEIVKIISERTHLSPDFIRSTYHSSGATLASTIAALCMSKDREVYTNPYVPDAPPATIESQAKDLSTEFSHRLQHAQAHALIKLTYPSTTSARELALALTSSPTIASASTTTIIPQYTPRPPSPPSASPSTSTPSHATPLSASAAASLSTTRSTAHSQSLSAYRKAKSDHLMYGAAAYYSTISRSAAAALRDHEAARADAQVTAQSKPGEVDLHGLTVKDAVRVCRHRVESWWEDEGREWARQGKVMNEGGLRIVTGVGRHSAGGRAVVGPAVGKMLNEEGWRVQVGMGVVKVVGRARR